MHPSQPKEPKKILNMRGFGSFRCGLCKRSLATAATTDAASAAAAATSAAADRDIFADNGIDTDTDSAVPPPRHTNAIRSSAPSATATNRNPTSSRVPPPRHANAIRSPAPSTSHGSSGYGTTSTVVFVMPGGRILKRARLQNASQGASVATSVSHELE